MSYVLDALRRAEAERQRGRVPGLDAQPLPAPGADVRPAAPTGRRAWIVGLALAVGLLAVAAWWGWATPGAPAPVPAPAEMAPARPAPPLAVAPPPPPARALRPAPPPPVTAEPTPAPDGRPVRLQNLPEAERRQFPALAFGGAIDSPQPEARMLVINGQVWREGDEALPGLRLERITLRSATFRWRNRSVEVPLD